jgi:hypothetical protein
VAVRDGGEGAEGPRKAGVAPTASLDGDAHLRNKTR